MLSDTTSPSPFANHLRSLSPGDDDSLHGLPGSIAARIGAIEVPVADHREQPPGLFPWLERIAPDRPLQPEVPALDHGDPRSRIPQRHREIGVAVGNLDVGSPAGQTRPVLVAPHDLLGRVSNRDGMSRGRIPICIEYSAIRAARFAERTDTKGRERQHERACRGAERCDRRPVGGHPRNANPSQEQ
jgi:hypothetical protein